MVRQTGRDARASRSAVAGSAANQCGFPEVGGRFLRRFAYPGHRQDAVRGGVGNQVQRNLLRLSVNTDWRSKKDLATEVTENTENHIKASSCSLFSVTSVAKSFVPMFVVLI